MKGKWNYVDEALGMSRNLKDGWLQDECCCRHLRAQEFTQDKTRREEDTSLSHSFTTLVEVLYSQNQSYYFKDLSTPFIIERAGLKVQEKLTREAVERSPSNSFYSST